MNPVGTAKGHGSGAGPAPRRKFMRASMELYNGRRWAGISTHKGQVKCVCAYEFAVT